MSRIVIPYHPASGQPEVVEQLVANDEAIASVVNGDLVAGTNIQTGPPTAALTGAANSEGAASTLLRSDFQAIIQGVEQLASNPTSGHFAGRIYFNTADNQHKYCSNVSAGTYTPFTNVAPTDVPIHGSNHGQSGSDPLPDLGVGSDMLGRSVQTKVLPSDITDIKGSWLTILDMDSVTLAGSQVVTFSGKIIFKNFTGGDVRLAWRIIDTSNSNAAVAAASVYPAMQTGQSTTLSFSDIVQQATGAHVYRLQAVQTGTTAGLDAVKDSPNAADGVTTHTYLNLLVG